MRGRDTIPSLYELADRLARASGLFRRGFQPRHRAHPFPHRLLDQFAQAVDGNKGYRACEQCGRWFELAPRTARADKLFCDGACRSRAARGRQQASPFAVNQDPACRSRAARGRQLQAGQLFEAGRSIAEIAITVHSTPSVIRRWLKQGGKAGVPATDSKSPVGRSKK
jgi:hypothetical protein